MQTEPLLEKKLSFEEFGLRPEILRAVAEKKYTIPTPIQEKAIPIVLEGKDLIGCAQTGTGKTAAFALPILHRLQGTPWKGTGRRPIRVLVLTPTRELASQIAESFGAYGRHTALKHAIVFGGVNQGPQSQALRRGIDILVATPGRLLDLMSQGLVQLRTVETFVLDEADRMLDMGFIHDIRRVIDQLPAKRQTLFFSATMPREIQGLADTILRDPVRVAVTPVATPAEAVEQRVYFVEKSEKIKLLKHLLDGPSIKNALVFTRTKHGADAVTKQLERYAVRAEAIHGNKSQNARERALASFKRGATRVLVATDIAARGLDIVDVSHVVNFDLPNVPESYVHRIGRTGRAGASGIALSFCSVDERPFLADIERLIRKHLPVVEDHPYRSGYGAGTPTNLDPRQAHGAAALSMVHPDMVSRRGKYDPSNTRPDGRPGRSRRESKTQRSEEHADRTAGRKHVTFEAFGLRPELLRAVAEKKYTIPTPIQEKAIPIVLEGRDLIGCAQTGTGKTAAFALPILHRLQGNPLERDRAATDPRPRADADAGAGLPDRGELRHLRQAHGPQARHRLRRRQPGAAGAALRRGIDILVATPGRLLDLMSQGLVQLRTVETFVLDEADRMLDMGFIHDIRRVIDQLPAKRQTLFFSATMPREIQGLADTILRDPIRVAVTPVATPAEAVEQRVHYVEKSEKIKLLKHLLDGPSIKNALVFTRTKHGADAVTKQLERFAVRAEAIHGNKSQNAREKALCELQAGRDESPRGDGHRRPGPRHRRPVARGQLRPPERAGKLRPPDRAHGKGRRLRDRSCRSAPSTSAPFSPISSGSSANTFRWWWTIRTAPGTVPGRPTNLDPRQAHGAAARSMVHPDMPTRRGKNDASNTRPDGRPGRSRRESKWTGGFGAEQADPPPRFAPPRGVVKLR